MISLQQKETVTIKVDQKKKWQKGRKKIDENQMKFLCDLLNRLSVRKQQELWSKFTQKYTHFQLKNNTFTLD